MAGYIVEKTLRADEADSLNRNAIAAVNIDGGNMVTFGAYNKGVFTVALASAPAAGLGMAYNPVEHLTQVGEKVFAGLSADPRDYTNIANRPFDVFIPKAGDIIGFTAGNISNGVAAVDSYLVPAADGKLAVASDAASVGVSFKILALETLPFPRACIGMEEASLVVCECVEA